MRKIVRNLLCAGVILLAFSTNVYAMPPQEEINQLLSELGWQMEDLENYLQYYEMTLADFETMEELEMFVQGTPITPENLNELLEGYEMTRAELDTLLAEFGETVEDDYFFIEDLDIAVDFYQNHDDMMLELENFLSAIGITEEEADNLFNYFMALDELELESKMEQVGTRLESLMMTMDSEAEITEEQKTELVSIWEEIMAAVQLNPKFYLVNAAGTKTPISFGELASMEEFASDALFIELYTTQGTMILDLQLSEDMLGSEFVLNAGEKMADIGDLAGELTLLKHEKLPNTASPYVSNMLFGLFIMMVGTGLYFYNFKRRMTR